MPIMPRIPGKGKKIAFKILGIPNNMKAVYNKKQQRVERRLLFEQTSRVR